MPHDHAAHDLAVRGLGIEDPPGRDRADDAGDADDAELLVHLHFGEDRRMGVARVRLVCPRKCWSFPSRSARRSPCRIDIRDRDRAARVLLAERSCRPRARRPRASRPRAANSASSSPARSSSLRTSSAVAADRMRYRGRHPRSAFHRRLRQGGVAELDADVLDRQAEHVGRDLRHDRIGAGADVGRRAGHFRVAVGGQHDAGRHRHLQRFPDAGRHAPADQLAAVAHRARLRLALAPSRTPPRPGGSIRAAALLVYGMSSFWSAIRVAAQPQLHGIELERDGKLVHRAFERIDAGRRARRAHVAGGRNDRAAPACAHTSRSAHLVEQGRPAGVVAREFLELRGDRDRLVGDRVERSVGLGAEREALDRGRAGSRARTSAGASARAAPSARSAQRAQHRQHHLILRPQPGAEPAADERRHHAQIVRLPVEHAAQIALHILHALGLVVDRELAAAVPRPRSRQTAPSGCDARSE